MSALIWKLVLRFVMGVIALSAGMALVIVFLVFSRGTGILQDRTFIQTVEIVGFFIPIASAIFVIPNTIREHRTGKQDAVDP